MAVSRFSTRADLLTRYRCAYRLEPFTTQQINIKSGRFDYASRLFRLFGDSFEFVCSNINDCRELIPEFFFEPEVLQNINAFDLGKTDEGNALLPPWAGDPSVAPYFVYSHRKAPEPEHVSQTLNNWIDLIWGYKQRPPYFCIFLSTIFAEISQISIEYKRFFN